MSDLNEGLSQEAVEELKPAEGESSADYAERLKGVKERLREEGFSVSEGWILPGEDGPGAALERSRMLRQVREEQKPKAAAAEPANTDRKDTKMTEFSRPAAENRLQGQRREAEKAVSAFEEQAKKLYREDGSRVYSAEEHQERHAGLTDELAAKLSEIMQKAEEDARTYEGEAKSYDYRDPVAGLSSSDWDRLSASAPLVKEDVERLPVAELVERLKAVSGGRDVLAKVLHARYARFRARQISESRAQELQSGAASPGNPSGDAARLMELENLVSELESSSADPDAVERQEKARSAATESRGLVREISRRQGEVDGSNIRARQRAAEATRAAF